MPRSFIESCSHQPLVLYWWDHSSFLKDNWGYAYCLESMNHVEIQYRTDPSSHWVCVDHEAPIYTNPTLIPIFGISSTFYSTLLLFSAWPACFWYMGGNWLSHGEYVNSTQTALEIGLKPRTLALWDRSSISCVAELPLSLISLTLMCFLQFSEYLIYMRIHFPPMFVPNMPG